MGKEDKKQEITNNEKRNGIKKAIEMKIAKMKREKQRESKKRIKGIEKREIGTFREREKSKKERKR